MFQEMLAAGGGGGGNATISINEYQLSTNVVGEHVDFTCTNAYFILAGTGENAGFCTMQGYVENGVLTKVFKETAVDAEYNNGVLTIKRVSAYAPQYCYIQIMYE